MKIGGPRVAREEDTGMRQVTLLLSRLAVEALTGGDAVAMPPARLRGALRWYVEDSDSDRPAWPYPGFLRGSETRGEIQVEVEVEPDLWRSFAAEAAAQGVSPAQLAEHAAFYFAAEMDTGRVTERILEDLQAAEAETGGD